MLKITTLMENEKGAEGLTCENGLSLYLQKEGLNLLFDCGQTPAFLNNAKALGVTPKADIVVLSHGHFDHANGFPAYLERFSDFDLYLGDGFYQERRSVEPDKIRDLSACFKADLLKDKNVRVHTVTENKTKIADGVWLVKNFDQTCPLETFPKRMQIVIDSGDFAQDTFPDEICLVLESEKGLIVVVGCSHPGIVNMLKTIEQRFDNQKIYAVIGGTHFRDASPEQIQNAIAYLYEIGVEILGLSHCSGDISPYLTEGKAQYFRFTAGTVKEL